MRKAILSCVLSICFVLIVPNAATAQTSFDSSITDDGKHIPPEFGQDENTILIVAKMGSKKYDKEVAANFKQYYAGKYIVLDAKSMAAPSYRNLNIYRYVFRIHGMIRMMGSDFVPTGKITLGITDQVTEKLYNTSQISPEEMYSRLMVAYIKALEEKRRGL